MEQLTGIHWRATFVPDTPFLEIFLRGSIVYLVIFGLLRGVLNRQAGAVGITDLLVIVLIADAAQNAMASDYKSLPDGILLVATIVFWAYALDWLGFRIPAVGRLVRPPALPLVRDGRMLRRNMQRELITDEELHSQLRLQGSDDLTQVKAAYMEGDGRISFIMRKPDDASGKAPERQTS